MTTHEKELLWLAKEKYGSRALDELASNKQFLKDKTRLSNGEPLAYVIGFSIFLGAHIDLRYRPLIPRPETEFWTERVIKSSGNRQVQALDLFCGSGCIGIAILKNCPNATVDFADIDEKALRQTRLNLRLNQIASKRFRILRSDVWSGIPDKEYDIVTANPPYIPSSRLLPDSVSKFEPHQALFSGRKGNIAMNKFLSGLPRHLAANGTAFLEFDSRKSIVPLITSFPRLKFRFRRDQYSRSRYAELGHAR